MPAIRERGFQLLRRKLELANAHDIEIGEPERVWVDGYVDEEGDWQALDKPYWAWEVMAIGQADA